MSHSAQESSRVSPALAWFVQRVAAEHAAYSVGDELAHSVGQQQRFVFVVGFAGTAAVLQNASTKKSSLSLAEKQIEPFVSQRVLACKSPAWRRLQDAGFLSPSLEGGLPLLFFALFPHACWLAFTSCSTSPQRRCWRLTLRNRHCQAAGPRLALRAQCRGSFDL